MTVLLALTISSCGSDNKSSGDGGTTVTGNLNTSNASGNAGSLSTVEQFRDAVSNGLFSIGSVSGIYEFRKESGSVSFSCKNGVYSGNYNDKYGARALRSDMTISRNFNAPSTYPNCYIPVDFNDDVLTSTTLNGLAQELVGKINSAIAIHDYNSNPTIRKVINNYPYNNVPSGYTCEAWENNCSQIKSAVTKVWDVRVNGEWLRIDLNSSLIKQPVARFN